MRSNHQFRLIRRPAGAVQRTDFEYATAPVRALEEGDGKLLHAILHDHMTYSHSDGRVWTKEVLLAAVAGKKRYLSVATADQSVDVVGDVGIVRHTYDVVNNDEKKTPGHLKVLLCWTRQGTQGWQLLARSGTTIPA